MKWFGEGWSAPICTPENLVPVPKHPCFHCEGHFDRDDRGVVLPFHGSRDGEEEAPYHQNCLLWVLGLTSVDPRAD